MSIEDRVRLLARIADGSVPVRDFLGLSPSEIRAIERLGASAYQGKRFDLAISVFTALESLEPDVSIHSVHRALAEHAAGRIEAAIASTTRYLDRDERRPDDRVAEVLAFRASLRMGTDRARAEADLRAAYAIAPGLFPEKAAEKR